MTPVFQPASISAKFLPRLLQAAGGGGRDTRLLAMVIVLGLIWLSANVLTGGIFLSPRNLFNLSLQVSVVAIMASGMILVIVTRHIDLSVGSQVGFLGVLGGLVQSVWFPGNTHAWWIASLAMLAGGMLIGLIQGVLVAYARIPSFVVTLGGLLFLRNAAYELNDGTTIAPLNETFQILGGGQNGVLGGPLSWAAALAVTAYLAFNLRRRYQRKKKLGIRNPLRAFDLLSAAIWCLGAFGFVAVMNSYKRPGTDEAMGLAFPVLILIAVTVLMTVLARRHRFGRHVFAVGGDPHAARLTGINTQRVVLKVFVLMGFLSGLASIVLTARLNAAASGAGTMMELYVIAAAVIGGTSLAGGAGTILGGCVGALIMQSLQSAMVLLGIASPLQSMVLAGVLVLAVWIDTMWRERRPS
ncbi:sugar ABC transporter permease [Rhizobium sp. BK251]|uniref:sugar ABC transporter permease n=1 Tax=Rhizobium sp. BK251 TaxID=2512125 RepID=UPI00104DAEFC|nr:sugar ABC transporter permease [Rhizobium sp. BK251]TCL64101.1 xylose ABC transporter membrane protein [Rhizobium sp. BK251]